MFMQVFSAFSMLGNKWNQYFGNENHPYYWLNTVFDWLYPTLYAIMAVAGAAGAIYAIVLGINLASAEDQSKREEAKKKTYHCNYCCCSSYIVNRFLQRITAYDY